VVTPLEHEESKLHDVTTPLKHEEVIPLEEEAVTLPEHEEAMSLE
jgi:hypothetical protein